MAGRLIRAGLSPQSDDRTHFLRLRRWQRALRGFPGGSTLPRVCGFRVPGGSGFNGHPTRGRRRPRGATGMHALFPRSRDAREGLAGDLSSPAPPCRSRTEPVPESARRSSPTEDGLSNPRWPRPVSAAALGIHARASCLRLNLTIRPERERKWALYRPPRSDLAQRLSRSSAGASRADTERCSRIRRSRGRTRDRSGRKPVGSRRGRTGAA